MRWFKSLINSQCIRVIKPIMVDEDNDGTQSNWNYHTYKRTFYCYLTFVPELYPLWSPKDFHFWNVLSNTLHHVSVDCVHMSWATCIDHAKKQYHFLVYLSSGSYTLTSLSLAPTHWVGGCECVSVCHSLISPSSAPAWCVGVCRLCVV